MRTDLERPLQGRRLLVAASGSIAAVKTPLLVSALVKAGAEVRCLLTPARTVGESCGDGHPQPPSLLPGGINGIQPAVPDPCISNSRNGLS